MHGALQFCTWAIGLSLYLLVISALLRGPYRQYPFVFAYALASFFSTVAEIAAHSFPPKVQAKYYWTDEIVLDVLVFCLVLAFIDQAARQSPRKVIQRYWLILGAVLIGAGSYVIHRASPPNFRMTLISRDLNICAVILDLILWLLLLSARRPDRTLLLLSGGLGLQLTGAIMGGQLIRSSPSLYPFGAFVEVSSSLLGTYIWWRALRAVPVVRAEPIKKGGLPREPTRY
jgi:hypothetical protein